MIQTTQMWAEGGTEPCQHQRRVKVVPAAVWTLDYAGLADPPPVPYWRCVDCQARWTEQDSTG